MTLLYVKMIKCQVNILLLLVSHYFSGKLGRTHFVMQFYRIKDLPHISYCTKMNLENQQPCVIILTNASQITICD